MALNPNPPKLFTIKESHPFANQTHRAEVHNLEGNRAQIPDDYINPLAKVILPAPTSASSSPARSKWRESMIVPGRPTTPVGSNLDQAMWTTPPRQRPTAEGVTPPRPMCSPQSTYRESKVISTTDIDALTASFAGSQPSTPTHVKRQARIVPASDFGMLTYFDEGIFTSVSSSSSAASISSFGSDSSTSTLCSENDMLLAKEEQDPECKKSRGLLSGLFGKRSCFEIEEFTLEDHYHMVDQLKNLGML